MESVLATIFMAVVLGVLILATVGAVKVALALADIKAAALLLLAADEAQWADAGDTDTTKKPADEEGNEDTVDPLLKVGKVLALEAVKGTSWDEIRATLDALTLEANDVKEDLVRMLASLRKTQAPCSTKLPLPLLLGSNNLLALEDVKQELLVVGDIDMLSLAPLSLGSMSVLSLDNTEVPLLLENIKVDDIKVVTLENPKEKMLALEDIKEVPLGLDNIKLVSLINVGALPLNHLKLALGGIEMLSLAPLSLGSMSVLSLDNTEVPLLLENIKVPLLLDDIKKLEQLVSAQNKDLSEKDKKLRLAAVQEVALREELGLAAVQVAALRKELEKGQPQDTAMRLRASEAEAEAMGFSSFAGLHLEGERAAAALRAHAKADKDAEVADLSEKFAQVYSEPGLLAVLRAQIKTEHASMTASMADLRALLAESLESNSTLQHVNLELEGRMEEYEYAMGVVELQSKDEVVRAHGGVLTLATGASVGSVTVVEILRDMALAHKRSAHWQGAHWQGAHWQGAHSERRRQCQSTTGKKKKKKKKTKTNSVNNCSSQEQEDRDIARAIQLSLADTVGGDVSNGKGAISNEDYSKSPAWALGGDAYTENSAGAGNGAQGVKNSGASRVFGIAGRL